MLVSLTRTQALDVVIHISNLAIIIAPSVHAQCVDALYIEDTIFIRSASWWVRVRVFSLLPVGRNSTGEEVNAK